MDYRTFGRTGWRVSEIGCGMWGMAGWSGSEDRQSLESLNLAVELGANFFDTAYAYGEGRSERLLGQIIRQQPGDCPDFRVSENGTVPFRRLYAATKIPPKNRQWPSRRGSRLNDVFPPDYIRQMTEKSLDNLGLDCVDLQQFHVWEDSWAGDYRWQRAVDDLKREGLVRAVGISINRWEPANSLATLRTGLIDAVQVIYNIFDQSPEDELFPLCEELGVAVIARVPLDEGSLTGVLRADSHWPEGDWRNSYFVPENLAATVQRVDHLKPLVPEGMTLADMALRWILANPAVSTIIPGMRKPSHVRSNLAAGDAGPLSPKLMQELKQHRWDRQPTAWSQ
jgi:aryl-alcohol dehydrogenase-like predicted oxidoreductase